MVDWPAAPGKKNLFPQRVSEILRGKKKEGKDWPAAPGNEEKRTLPSSFGHWKLDVVLLDIGRGRATGPKSPGSEQTSSFVAAKKNSRRVPAE
jgi:hypothetical protein